MTKRERISLAPKGFLEFLWDHLIAKGGWNGDSLVADWNDAEKLCIDLGHPHPKT